MRACLHRKAAHDPVGRTVVALPLLLVVLCGFAGAGERVSVPCPIPDSQPLFSRALERGVKESATLQALLAALSADERVTLYFALGDLSPGLRARSRVRMARHRDCHGDCLVRLDAAILVRWRASRRGRIAAAAHELVHLLRLLHGSVDEGRGSLGETIADRIERRVLEELSPRRSPGAGAGEQPFEPDRLLDEVLTALPAHPMGNSIRVERVHYERIVPEARAASLSR